MTSYVPAKKNAEFIFYVALIDRATGLIKTTPTLAAGDVKISKDGGATANLTTLPAETPASSGMVKVTVSSTEMNADNVSIKFSDAAGAEWLDLFCNIQTSARQIDDLAWPTTTGRSIDVDASGGVEVGSFQAGAITAAAHAAGAIDAAALAADAGTEIATAVWASGTRILTALDEDTTTLDLDATIRAAMGLAAANLDTQLSAIAGFIDTEVVAILAAVDTEVAAIKAKTDSLTFTVAGVLDSNVTYWKGSVAVAMTGDAYARLGAPVGASISADIAAISGVITSGVLKETIVRPEAPAPAKPRPKPKGTEL
jgi:hypothetical protein